MGFGVTYAIDNWNPAIEAHKLNQPETEAMQADIENLDPKLFLDRKPDVLIGGPPCQEFSGSKRGGGGDIQKGMRLVLAFFRFVHVLKPKYWVMENVPRLAQTLPHRVRLQDMGIPEDGFFDIPRIEPFNSADFGAPQKRLRLLSGRYPSPIQTHFEESMLTLDNVLYQPWVRMRKVIESFPNPLKRRNPEACVRDPNFDIKIKEKQLEDHFFEEPLYKGPGEGLMTRDEAARNKRQKVAHAYYGRMQFPDNLDRPARTVMATQFNASRETMVIETRFKGKVRYRKPTVRECASLQCYPVTYAFPGKTLATKYKLVGNSVPVFLSAAIAKAILKEEGMKIPEMPILAATP